MPYLLDLRQGQLRPPLSMFNNVAADREGTLRLVESINRRVPGELSERQLERTFEKWWPDLDARLEDAREAANAEGPAPEPRPVEEMLEELLAIAREGTRPASDPMPKKAVVGPSASRRRWLEEQMAALRHRVPEMTWTLTGVGRQTVTVTIPADANPEGEELRSTLTSVAKKGYVVNVERSVEQ